MELVIKAVVIGISTALIALTLRQTVPGLSLGLSIAATALIAMLAFQILEPVADFLGEIIAVCNLSGIYSGPILKCMCISILSAFGASLCKDAGQSSAATAIELVAAAAALYAALPLFTAFLHMVRELL